MTTTKIDRAAYDVYAALLKTTGGLDVLDQLGTCAQVAREVENATASRVLTARTEGATWQQIADALGVSRQAVQQRYGA